MNLMTIVDLGLLSSSTMEDALDAPVEDVRLFEVDEDYCIYLVLFKSDQISKIRFDFDKKNLVLKSSFNQYFKTHKEAQKEFSKLTKCKIVCPVELHGPSQKFEQIVTYFCEMRLK